MTREIAQSIIDTAWREILQRKANADIALAEKRWEDAGEEVTRLRYACSDLEHGLVMMRWVERNSAQPPRPGDVLIQSPLGTEFPNVIRAIIRVQEMERRLTAAVEGTREANRELGGALRFYREQNKISLRAVAAHLKCSAPYLSDCELGHRTLSDKHREQYLNFLHPGRILKIA